jgi:putative NADH-flavin reductase
MRLAIFGATGRIGGHLLNWAVDAGHTCTSWPAIRKHCGRGTA